MSFEGQFQVYKWLNKDMWQLGQYKNILGMTHVPSCRLKPHMNQQIHENRSNPEWPIKN